MSPAIGSPAPVVPPPAATAANASTASADDSGALAPFVVELAAAAADVAAPDTEPASADPAPAGDGETDADSVAGLLNLILALAPPPAPAAPAATTDATLNALASSDLSAPTSGLAAFAAEALPAGSDSLALPAANDAASFADLLVLPQLPAAPTLPASIALPSSTAPLPMTSERPPLALDQPQWCHELGERLLWSTEQGLSQATIELHPQELGPIRVHITTEGDTASIALQAAHAATRELLAVSLPQLRELLNAQGLQLGRSQVGPTASNDSGRDAGRRGDGSAAPGSLPLRRRWRVGVVDQYV